MDLGAGRTGSFRPSSSRPPPVGRSQSSSDLQFNRNGTGCGDKKRTISPLAIHAVKRFSFDSMDKRQHFYAMKDPKAEIALTITEADKSRRSESPQAGINETGYTGKSPSAIRRDNIDGCESEKEISDIGERTNAGFSGDEDEEFIHIKSGGPKEEPIVIGLRSVLNHVDEDSMISSQNVTPWIVDSSAPCQDRLSSDKQNDTVCDSNSDSIPESTRENVQNPMNIETTKALLDQNDNFQSAEMVQSKLSINRFEINDQFPEETGEFARQNEEKMELPESRTLDSTVHDADSAGAENASSDKIAGDFPAYKKKEQRKKEKRRNDRIEKTFFV